MKTTFSLLLCFVAIVFTATGQDSDGYSSSAEGESALGLGIGLPYGGIGVRFGFNVVDNLNTFGGFGFQIAGMGFNFGLRQEFASTRQTQFYLTGMFGTNAATKVQGLPEYDKTYTGFSLGAGIKINSRKKQGNYWDLGLLLPLKSSAFKDAENTIKNDPRITDFTGASPILVVIGYNFSL